MSRPFVTFLATGAMALLLTLIGLQPRLEHTFPSMVDDWAAISRSPHQIGDALTLHNTEGIRYRPGFIIWNYLQWHTFGGPGNLVVPSVWGVLRVMALVFGLAGAAFVLVGRSSSRRGDDLIRALLAGGAVVAVTTIPHSASDLAQYGPQEPLMVGLMCGGGALLTIAVRGCLAGTASIAQTWVLGLSGVLLWTGGIAQKETSVCALLLIPFLWMGTQTWRASLPPPSPGARRLVSVLLALGFVAFVPMFARVVQLSLADTRVYGAEPNKDVIGPTLRQLWHMTSAIGSIAGVGLLLGAIALIAVVAASGRFEWIAIGLLLTGLASLAFAAQTPYGPSRYFLPLVALSALAIVRLASATPYFAMLVVACILAFTGLLQVPAARHNVREWASGEREQEQIVRAVAERRAAGCPVQVAGTDVEMITALPVLESIAHQRAGGCVSGERFLALITGSQDSNSANGDPALAACGTGRVVVVKTSLARVFRCEPIAA
jgi:hypothetical protein